MKHELDRSSVNLLRMKVSKLTSPMNGGLRFLGKEQLNRTQPPLKMMRALSLVLVGLLVIALSEALPSRSHSRQKRGFRINSASRVAHGYGKRQFDTWEDSTLKSDSPR
ncbi:hypothetical protein BaRGS_00014275 [Batillaria attramentaria]|uniref:Uncharacterized protein n=1 Tax=Batillaria attramentaria TaxID=370345 RepID=A0ABD0L542_9CAEN